MRLGPEAGDGHDLRANTFDPITVKIFAVSEKARVQLPGLDADSGNDVARPYVNGGHRIA